MKDKHTPGPWRVVNKPRLSSLEVYAGDTAICELWRRADRAAEHATAQLIAAAPDLLEALKAINEAACYVTEEDPSNQRMGLLLIGTIARDVIAKAEGRA